MDSNGVPPEHKSRCHHYTKLLSHYCIGHVQNVINNNNDTHIESGLHKCAKNVCKKGILVHS